MSNDILKYFSKAPKNAKLLESIKIESKRFIHSIKFIFQPYENSLPAPEKNIPWEKNNWSISDEEFEIAKDLYQRSDERHNKLEEKSQKMFGVTTFFIPILLGVIAYLLENSLGVITLILIFISLFFYFLALWGCLRAIRVKERQSPGLSLFVDPSTDQMINSKKEKIAACLLFCSQYNERMNDQIANYIRASETFIFVAVLFTLLSGGAGLYTKTTRQDTKKDFSEAILTEVKSGLTVLKEISMNFKNTNSINEHLIQDIEQRLQKIENTSQKKQTKKKK